MPRHLFNGAIITLQKKAGIIAHYRTPLSLCDLGLPDKKAGQRYGMYRIFILFAIVIAHAEGSARYKNHFNVEAKDCVRKVDAFLYLTISHQNRDITKNKETNLFHGADDTWLK